MLSLRCSNMKDCLFIMHTLPTLFNLKTPLQYTCKKKLEHRCMNMGQKQIWLVITKFCEIT